MRYSSTREADASTAQFGKLSEKGATASQTNPKDPPDDDDACDRARMYMYLVLDEKSRPAGMCKTKQSQHSEISRSPANLSDNRGPLQVTLPVPS